MQSNVRGWHNIPIATVLIKFIDGRFVKFLYRCYSAHRFDQIVSELYKRRIAFKPFHRAATLLVRNRSEQRAHTRNHLLCWDHSECYYKIELLIMLLIEIWIN